ncbi:MAG: HAMP domain-containing sensor histidine kinase [Pseudomonadales bacterium]
MTPEAVIYRYLETAALDPQDVERFTLLVGCDADLLGRWLRLLRCPAQPDALKSAIGDLEPDRFRDLASAQAWAVLAVSGAARLGFDQWQSVLASAVLAEVLAEELGLADPTAVRWRVLLASSGVNLPHDALLTEMLEFRGARPELLEDASLHHRLFAVVEAQDVMDTGSVQDLALALLNVEPGRFQTLGALAEQRLQDILQSLALVVDPDGDWAERLWLRLQMGILGHLFDGLQLSRGSRGALSLVHELVSRSLFGSVPLLLLREQQASAQSGIARTLLSAVNAAGVGGGAPLGNGNLHIGLDSSASIVARCARLGERTELMDRTDQAVIDRQILRRMQTPEAVCMPLRFTGGDALGVLVFAVDEDVDQESTMALYAEELARYLNRAGDRAVPEDDRLTRYRSREHKRLREIVHEANNPLSIVHNYLHILELRLAHEPDAVQQIRMIDTELRRAGEIIAQVRDLPPIEESAPAAAEVVFADLDVNALVRTVVELHQGYALDHHVQLSAALSFGALMISSDEHRLAQILNNLVRNAIEAAAGGTVTVASAGGVFREGREGVRITVADSGPGLPREVLARLAEPKQSTKGGDHAGLGLSIVHRLVNELRGGIEVQTGAGEGTTFTLFLSLEP